MKKRFNFFCAMTALSALLFTACSNYEEPAPATDGAGDEMVTFTLTPDQGVQTRATNPGIPTGKVLRYIMEIYDAAGTSLATTVGTRQVVTTADESTPVTFSIKKTAGENGRKVVFWADFTDETKPKDDLFYDTTTGGLKAVTFKTGNKDMHGEAFYGGTTLDASGTPAATKVVLKHSVAQINIITTAQLTGLGSTKVEYGETADTNAPMSVFNATDGTVATNQTFIVINTVDAAETNMNYTFHTYYAFAPKDTQGVINMRISMCDDAAGANTPKSITDVPNVPLQANYKTNITGNFGEEMVVFTVSCDADWSTPDNDKNP